MAGRFSLLADEHVPRSLVQALQEHGWTVERVVDLTPELGPGADDDRLFTYAVQRGFVVLSSDERALWRPRRYRDQGAPFVGMICWPKRHRDRMTIGEVLKVLERLTLEDDPFAYGYRFIQPE